MDNIHNFNPNAYLEVLFHEKILNLLHQDSLITEMNLENYRLYNQYEKRWRTFCTALQINHTVTKLLIGGNRIGRMDTDRIKYFFNAITYNDTLSYLNLENNKLGYLSDTSWKDFCFALRFNRRITTLNLSWNKLYKLTPTHFQSFCNSLAANCTLKKLTLWHNSLNILDEPCWEAFCTALTTNRSLKTLALGLNQLNTLSDKKWKQFSEALKENGIISEMDEDLLKEELSHKKLEELQGILKHNAKIAKAKEQNFLKITKGTPDLKSLLLFFDNARSLTDHISIEKDDSKEEITKEDTNIQKRHLKDVFPIKAKVKIKTTYKAK